MHLNHISKMFQACFSFQYFTFTFLRTSKDVLCFTFLFLKHVLCFTFTFLKAFKEVLCITSTFIKVLMHILCFTFMLLKASVNILKLVTYGLVSALEIVTHALVDVSYYTFKVNHSPSPKQFLPNKVILVQEEIINVEHTTRLRGG